MFCFLPLSGHLHRNARAQPWVNGTALGKRHRRPVTLEELPQTLPPTPGLEAQRSTTCFPRRSLPLQLELRQRHENALLAGPGDASNAAANGARPSHPNGTPNGNATASQAAAGGELRPPGSRSHSPGQYQRNEGAPLHTDTDTCHHTYKVEADPELEALVRERQQERALRSSTVLRFGVLGCAAGLQGLFEAAGGGGQQDQGQGQTAPQEVAAAQRPGIAQGR